ncbi:MAG TPA: class 1 fructose-bisphosphatase [Paracoccaceae bacterium]|nr:class 1 fructose-bisphosphatase [Paracoccaceae bacterium]
MNAVTLDAYLTAFEAEGRPLRPAIAETVRQLAQAAVTLRLALSHGVLGPAFAGTRGTNADGDRQLDLDILADNLFLDAMRTAPVALYASEERAEPALLAKEAPLALALDPLDGSSGVEANAPVGSIFSILPALPAPESDPTASFLQPGANQLAAGFFIFGPQLALVLTLGGGTRIFVHSAGRGSFVQAYASRAIPPRTQEFAINASNYRHWDEAVRLYVDDCLKGAEGPRGKDFNMRWVASLVAECYRILIRGGVFLYPGDERRGYHQGRLRIVYEANPIAFLIEQAGGAATDTVGRILDIAPNALHQRTPLVFGSAREVERIARYHTAPSSIGERAPLFGHRGLFRA